MKKEVKFMIGLAVAIFIFTLIFSFGSLKNFTGFVVFTQDDASGFDTGAYSNTSYSGGAVVLVGGNLSGNYVSEVFDAGDDAMWNSLITTQTEGNVDYIYGVDGGGDVYSSIDSGVTWSMSKENYGRTTDTQEMFADSNYMYIISQSNREVWRSSDGASWSVVDVTGFDSNGLLMGESDGSGNLYVVDGSGDVWLSVNFGVDWTSQGDFNGGANDNAKGFGIDSSGGLYVTDSSKGVFYSDDSGVTWVTNTADHGGSGASLDDLEIDSSDNLYLLENSEIWKSSNAGVDWTKINSDFSPYGTEGCKMLIYGSDFYIGDCAGRVFNSSDSGVTWNEKGDLNGGGAGNDVKGLTVFSEDSSLTWQVRNCSSSDCSDGSWESVNLSSIGNVSRYFQYTVDFVSPDSSVSPSLVDVTLDYIMVNSAPVVSVSSPVNQVYNVGGIDLNFSASDVDGNLENCSYAINAGARVVIDCSDTNLSFVEGSYSLVVYANDSLGLEGSDSVSFDVDLTGVSVSIVNPTGVKTSRTGIVLDYTVTGSGLTCWYNVKTSVGVGVLGNATLANCSDSSFDVSGDIDYVVNVFVNNTYGNDDSANSSFSIDTSSTPSTPPSGGGGGGVVTVVNGTKKLNLQIDEIKTIVYPGEEKTLKASVKNIGRVAVNKCKLTGGGVSSDDMMNIGVGEIVDFVFVLSVPNVDSFSPEVKVECEEGEASVVLEVILVKASFDIELTGIEVVSGEEIEIKYLIKSDADSRSDLVFSVYSGDELISEKTEEVAVGKEFEERVVVLNVDGAESGLLRVKIAKGAEVFLEDSIIYDKSAVTGYAGFDIGGTGTYVGLIVLVFLVIAFFIVRRIWKGGKKGKKKGER